MNSLDKKDFVSAHHSKLEEMESDSILDFIDKNIADGKVFSTSFGLEDQVITEKIASLEIASEIFTLDTGRHFCETYQVHALTLDKYKLKIKTYYPEQRALENLLSEKGPESFYLSVENRKECCNIRKVEPLKRALAGKNIWITGIRRAQSADRASLPVLEYDEDHDIIKVHPLINWSNSDVWDYVKEKLIPFNVLHKEGFVSIGCAPCTRAIKEGEDFRAGRWWWEDSANKECGLHVKK